MYVIGETTGDHQFTFEHNDDRDKPIDLKIEDMFGNPPKTVLTDTTEKANFADLAYDQDKIETYLEDVLQLEAVACKDWLTNKVDRSVTGKIAEISGKVDVLLHAGGLEISRALPHKVVPPGIHIDIDPGKIEFVDLHGRQCVPPDVPVISIASPSWASAWVAARVILFGSESSIIT